MRRSTRYTSAGARVAAAKLMLGSAGGRNILCGGDGPFPLSDGEKAAIERLRDKEGATRALTQAPSSPSIVSTSSARLSRLCETLGDIDCATATSDQKVVVGKLDSAVLSGIFASRDIAFVRPIDIMIT